MSGAHLLLEAFLERNPRAAGVAADELARWLEGLRADARAAWPDLDVADRTFGEHLGRTARAGASLDRRHAADLYLTCACLDRDAGALRAFDERLRQTVLKTVSRLDSSPAFLDLVAQEMRTRLLMGEPPKIAEYGGYAPLATWLKTIAVRTALNAKRGKEEEPRDVLGSGIEAVVAGPDTEVLRARFRAQFEAALKAALSRVPQRNRAVLVLHLRDGLGIDKIAAVYGTSRATAARWLNAARQSVELAVREELLVRLNITPSELRSLAGAVRSYLDVSLAKLVGETSS